METVIVDIDGVCFDSTDRLDRCRDGLTIDWKRAFSNKEVALDPPIKGAAGSTRIISRRYDIVYLTGRSETCREGTDEALRKHGFAEGKLIMKAIDDYNPDHVFKSAEIDKEAQREFIASIDDDWSGKLKDMYEDRGIPHFYLFEEFFEGGIG
jgi:hypothetical protein